VGEAGHHPLPWGASSGRLSAINIHDAGRGCGGCEPIQRLARTRASRTAVALEGPAVAQRNRLRATARAASTLAYRYFLHQREWHLLLSVQRFGWLQPFDRALGFAGIDDRSGNRSHFATSAREISRSETTDHLRQRTTV